MYLLRVLEYLNYIVSRGVEKAKFYTCPRTSKWPYCTSQMKILLVPKTDNAQRTPLSPSYADSLIPCINSLKSV